MKQNPRVIQLSILGGRLTGLMEIPLGLDRFYLPVPASVQLSHYHEDATEIDTTGPDSLEFVSTGMVYNVGDGKASQIVERFECINYGRN